MKRWRQASIFCIIGPAVRAGGGNVPADDGEYILYYRGKIAAYICDDRLLVKPVRSALSFLPTAPHEPPYAGAREMLVVEELEDRAFLERLFREMYDELPAPKQKK